MAKRKKALTTAETAGLESYAMDALEQATPMIDMFRWLKEYVPDEQRALLMECFYQYGRAVGILAAARALGYDTAVREVTLPTAPASGLN